VFEEDYSTNLVEKRISSQRGFLKSETPPLYAIDYHRDEHGYSQLLIRLCGKNIITVKVLNTIIPHRGKLWCGENFANLAICYEFASFTHQFLIASEKARGWA